MSTVQIIYLQVTFTSCETQIQCAPCFWCFGLLTSVLFPLVPVQTLPTLLLQHVGDVLAGFTHVPGCLFNAFVTNGLVRLRFRNLKVSFVWKVHSSCNEPAIPHLSKHPVMGSKREKLCLPGFLRHFVKNVWKKKRPGSLFKSERRSSRKELRPLHPTNCPQKILEKYHKTLQDHPHNETNKQTFKTTARNPSTTIPEKHPKTLHFNLVSSL